MKTNKLFKTSLLIIGLILVLSFGVSSVAAANSNSTIYVNTTGNDLNNGSSWQHAKATITNATGTVANNGTIYIANGTYYEHSINIKTNMTIIGESQTGTIINAQGNGNIFNIASGVTVILKNLTLENGNAGSGVGGSIYNNGNLTVSGSTFTDNTGWHAGAIYNDGTLTVTGSTFTDNTAYSADGGAIFNYIGKNLTE